MEYGPDIYVVTDSLVRAVADVLAGMPEYAGCETTAFAPEPVQPFRKVKRYGYVMTGQVIPPNASENILILNYSWNPRDYPKHYTLIF